MQNPIVQSGSYKEAEKKAKEFYLSIDKVWCPILADYIIFNRAGFEHLIGKRSVLRPKSERKRRFMLLQYTESILSDSAVQFEYEERRISHTTKINGERVTVTSKAHFWRFYAERDEKLIKLVIRQIENHQKHFFSIFEGKRKTAQ
jgi:hypothetical protein